MVDDCHLDSVIREGATLCLEVYLSNSPLYGRRTRENVIAPHIDGG